MTRPGDVSDLDELREAIREAHEATASLREATREAQLELRASVRRYLAKALEQVAADLRRG